MIIICGGKVRSNVDIYYLKELQGSKNSCKGFSMVISSHLKKCIFFNIIVSV